MPEKKTMVISSAEQLLDGKTRRNFLKLMSVGGAVFFLPSVLTSCNDDDDPDPMPGPGPNPLPGSGANVVIDFARGDIAIIQFAYALEQLEADFYTKVVAAFSTSTLTTAERAVITDVKNHEVIHRDAFKAIVIAAGASNDFTLTTTYGNLNFADRVQVLLTARTFEDLGVAAYNGAAQYFTVGANLDLAGKIVSVEARHASAIRDLIAQNNSGQGSDTSPGFSFAPRSFDDAFRPAKVETAAQAFVVQNLSPTNVPAAFVQGPNNNG